MSKVLHPSGGPKMADSSAHRLLRVAAVAFLVAVIIHGADHAVRGLDVVTAEIRFGGTVQFVAGVVVVGLVFGGHPWAPAGAVLVGFASAILFSVAHLLPSWGVFSDSYVTPAADAGVTLFSWVTALLEISADLLFGSAGLLVLSRGERGAMS